MSYNDQNFIFAENTGNPRVMRMVAIRLQRLMKLMDTDKHITPMDLDTRTHLFS